MKEKKEAEDKVVYTDYFNRFKALSEEEQRIVFFNVLQDLTDQWEHYDEAMEGLRKRYGKDRAEDAAYCIERGGLPEDMKNGKAFAEWYRLGFNRGCIAVQNALFGLMSDGNEIEDAMEKMGIHFSARELALKAMKRELDKFESKRGKA